MPDAIPMPPPLELMLTGRHGLNDCWVRALGEKNADLLRRKWNQAWNIKWQTSYAGASDDEQDEFFRRWRAIAGDWAVWGAFVLADLDPFRAWKHWTERGELPDGPVVGVEKAPGGKGRVVSARAFVLPLLPGQPTRKQEIKNGRIILWRHNQPLARVLLRFWAILLCCLIRNLLSFAVEPINLLLLLANMLAFAGAVLWREQPEVLEPLLIASVTSAACQTCYALFQIGREFCRVRNERWFWIWKHSTVRITGDPTRTPNDLAGDSDDLALVFELFAALAERVLREHFGGPLKSRLAAMMLPLIGVRGRYAATGRLGRLWFFLVLGVGDIGKKREAVDKAELSRFLVPATFWNMWLRLKDIWRPPLRRARLVLCRFVPIAAMKVGGTYRRGAVVSTLLTVAVGATLVKEWRIMQPPMIPVFAGSAPHLDTKNGSLELGFNPAPRLEEAYFVRLLLSIPRGEHLPPLVMPRDGDLGVESSAVVARVPLEYEGAIQDPNKVLTPSATLYRARAVWWFRLPLAVRTFEMPWPPVVGPQPVDFTCGGRVQAARPFRCTAAISDPPASPLAYIWQAADACRLSGSPVSQPAVDLIATEAGGAQCVITLTVTTSKGKNTNIFGYAQKKLDVEPASVAVKAAAQGSRTAPAQRVSPPPALLVFPPRPPGSPDTSEGWFTGHVDGQNLAAYKVAIYSEQELNRFELTDVVAIDDQGNWVGRIKRGVAYTAVLVRRSIDESKLQSLAAAEKDKIDSRRIESKQ